MVPNVSSETPALVMPRALCQSYTQTRTSVVWINEYSDGGSTRRAITNDSRRSWRLQQRLTNALIEVPGATGFRGRDPKVYQSAQIETLNDFYIATKNGLTSFWFYDLFETAPRFSYDPTGIAEQGRYAVRFLGGFDRTFFLGRASAVFSLIEVHA